ncbi:hypothetical protein FRACA_1440007 [Frankia canadensis]|uniref:Uncharacterized protein n=1 Tax=Frankia canadensis TaxID=1836972 RepID=A0A2I2KLK6_9ACTN|nr:hypothetical protein [Frankia canadensis]SNQ46543.1 hypothetical protein FRACA_1440007 [Frankia canadensis]SOU53833.1 hypothetical protein FRACA_1440007 [Frankia canadensis]
MRCVTGGTPTAAATGDGHLGRRGAPADRTKPLPGGRFRLPGSGFAVRGGSPRRDGYNNG